MIGHWLEDWIRSLLTDAILASLNGLFDGVNSQVVWASGELGRTPQQFSPEIFSMIRNLSETIIVPIAGLIMAFICTYELIQMIIEKNNLHEFELFNLFKWMLKTAVTIVIITNTWNIVMAVFDVGQRITASAAGVINTSAIPADELINSISQQLPNLNIGELLSMMLVTLLCNLAVKTIYVIVFVIVVGRMIEIYLATSIAPIPMATLLRKEGSHGMGQNYLRSLFALAFQAFLIMVCIGIYSILIRTINPGSGNLIMQLITIMAYTVLLCITMLKTGNLSKSIFNAH